MTDVIIQEIFYFAGVAVCDHCECSTDSPRGLDYGTAGTWESSLRFYYGDVGLILGGVASRTM